MSRKKLLILFGSGISLVLAGIRFLSEGGIPEVESNTDNTVPPPSETPPNYNIVYLVEQGAIESDSLIVPSHVESTLGGYHSVLLE